ncbi:MAG: TraB/GumN family protein [Cellulophaga sp.]
MKNNISLIIFLTITNFVVSQNTILWKVTDTINNKKSFIVGTFHQFGNSFVDSIPEIQKSLLNSEIAIFESIDRVENTRKIIQKRKKSFEIEKRLRRKDFEKLKNIAKEWKVDLYKLKPIEVEWKLRQEFQKIKCGTTKTTDEFDHFDNYLMHIANVNKIEIRGLETDSLQLKLIENQAKETTWKKARKTVRAWINQMTTNEPNMNNCQFANEYRKFDLDYEFEKECDNNSLIVERNNNWMKIIPNLLKNKNTFIAIGYSHLTKKCGILEQLKNLGFKIEPIKIKPVANTVYKT